MKKFLSLSLYFSIVLIAITLPLLIGMGYHATQFESLTIVACLFIIGSGLAVVLKNHKVLQNLFLCLAVYWLLDSYLPNDDWGLWIAIITAICFLYFLSTPFSENIHALLITFCLTWTLGCLISSPSEMLSPVSLPTQAAQINNKLRPIIHIVLDEQMSIKSIPESIPKSHPINKLVDDYTQRGFQHFSHAISHSNFTQVSLSELFFLSNNKNNSRQANQIYTHSLIRNNYFDKLHKTGYQVNVIQSNFLELCLDMHSINCRTYSRGTNGHSMQRFNQSYWDRFSLALLNINNTYSNPKQFNYVHLYDLISPITNKFNLIPRYRSSLYFTTPLMLDIFDQIDRDMTTLENGNAYFYHLLIPHFPYMLDSNCQLKPYHEWSAPNRYINMGYSEIQNNKIYKDYWDQSACAHKRVISIIDKIQQNKKIDAIIMVHGDHGSRISAKINKGNTTEMVETFFSIYDKKENGSEITETRELQPLFHEKINHLLQN